MPLAVHRNRFRNMGERVTIKELAKLSGVSVGTVSRALNGYTDVRPETRERIMRLARELDYTPAAAARSLVTQRSHIIGVFMETGRGPSGPPAPVLPRGARRAQDSASAPRGFDLLLFASERPGGGYGPHSYLKRCRHHNVDGCALIGLEPDDPEVRRLARAEIPCVGIDMALEGPLRRGRHVRQRGRRSRRRAPSARARPPADRDHHGHDRLAPGRRSPARLPRRDRGLGPRLPRRYVAYGDFYAEPAARPTERLLALEEPPTAIFAASDMMALGAVAAAAERGVRVPDDLSVVGFDDMQLVGLVQPPLTTCARTRRGSARPPRRPCWRSSTRRPRTRNPPSRCPSSWSSAPPRRRRRRRPERPPARPRSPRRRPAAPRTKTVFDSHTNAVTGNQQERRGMRGITRAVGAAVTAVALAAGVAACGGGSDDGGKASTSGGTGALQKGSTVRLWTMPNRPKPKEDLQKMVAPFTAKTGVKVEGARRSAGTSSSTASATRRCPARARTSRRRGPRRCRSSPRWAASATYRSASTTSAARPPTPTASGTRPRTRARTGTWAMPWFTEAPLDLLPQGRAREGRRGPATAFKDLDSFRATLQEIKAQGAGHRAVRRARARRPTTSSTT